MQVPSHLVGTPTPRSGGRDAYSSETDAVRYDDSHACRAIDAPVPPPLSSATASSPSPPRRTEPRVSFSPAALTSPQSRAQQSQSPRRPAAAVGSASNDMGSSLALVGTRDLQRGLLEQKLQSLQRECAASRAELKETTARLSDVTARLNEQKVETSALAHRYGACVEKLTVAEGSVKLLEEQLVAERQHHYTACAARDELRGSLREAEWELERLRAELAAERARPAVDPHEVQRLLGDRSRYVPAEEVRRRDEAMREAQDALAVRFTTALDELLCAQQDDETALFVARSTVVSAAADLEAKVSAAETTLAALCEQMAQFNEGSERDVSELVTALLVENKELWQRLARLKDERSAALAELAPLRRRCMADAVPREDYAYAQQQLAHTTARLEEAQRAVQTLTAVAREHEAEMRALADGESRAVAEAEAQSALLAEARAACAAALQRAEAAQAALEAARAEAAAQCRALRAEADEAGRLLVREAAELREAAERRDSDLRRGGQRLDECRVAARAAEAEAERLRAETDGLRAEVAALSQREAVLGAAAREREAELAALREALRGERARGAEAQREALRDEKARGAEAAEAAEAAARGAERLRGAAEAEAAQLREEAGRLREELDARRQRDRAAADGIARAEAERESLREENARLHAAHEEALREGLQLREALLLARRESKGGEDFAAQLAEVQERLRLLPALREAAEAARRSAAEAKDETNALRAERDAMAAKLEFFMNESRRAALKDEEWSQVFRDAAEQSRRLGGQLAAARTHGYAAQQTHGQRVLAAQAEQDTQQPQLPTHRPWR